MLRQMHLSSVSENNEAKYSVLTFNKREYEVSPGGGGGGGAEEYSHI